MPPGSPFGPRLRALALHLRFTQNIAFGRLEGLTHDLWGVAIRQGALVSMVRRAAASFAAQAGRLGERLRAGPVIASDETRLRVAGRNGWLWVVHHADTAVILADPSRGKRVLSDFLGDHRPDFWLSDRYAGQQGFATRGHQFCLAHLIRDARYAADAGDTAFAPSLVALFRRACQVGAMRDSLSDAQLAARQRSLVRALSGLLDRAPTHEAGARLQAIIARIRRNLFLFASNRAGAHQQWLRARASSLRDLPRGCRRLPHLMGCGLLRRHPLHHGDRPKARNPAPPGNHPHPQGMPIAPQTRLRG